MYCRIGNLETKGFLGEQLGCAMDIWEVGSDKGFDAVEEKMSGVSVVLVSRSKKKRNIL